MVQPNARTPGGRRAIADQDAYFTEAFDILARDGFRELSIATVVDRLGVTKGSFYHHFKNWDDFVWRLLARWEQEQTDRIMDLTFQTPDPIERLHVLKKHAAELPHATESALRAWSQSSATVESAMSRIDRRRHAFISGVCGDYVGDPSRGDVLATTLLALTIGLQSMSRTATAEEFFALYTIVDTAMDVERGVYTATS
ncbi:MAG: TetR/AcrR family transcriptional regulator [Myxococcota bacterium]